MIGKLYEDAIRAHQVYQQGLTFVKPMDTYAVQTAISVNKAFEGTDFNLAMHYVATNCKPLINRAVKEMIYG